MEKEDVHVRVSTDVMRQVRDWAERHGLSLSAAVSVLLTQATENQKRDGS